MKRTIFGLATILVVFLTFLAVLALRPLRTVKATNLGCSNRTLMGYYGWTESGYEPEETPPTSWSASALVSFDGHGTFSGTDVNEVDNGVLYSPINTSFTSGTYTVYPNCTVTIGYTWETDVYTDYGVVVGANGSEVVAAEQGPETTGHVDIKKIGD